MPELLPFTLKTGQIVYLNMDHVISIRYNGGFYVVTTTETVTHSEDPARQAPTNNRVYEVAELPFELR